LTRLRHASTTLWLLFVLCCLPGHDWAATQSNSAISGRGAPSQGCGRPAQGSGRFVRAALRAAGRERTYYLWLPASYDAQRAYPLVFRWHGSGGDGAAEGLGIEAVAGERAIIVAPDGLDRNWEPSSQPLDLQLFDALYAQLTQRYCVDQARVFSYGFSAGGGLTNLLSCARADKLRASAAIASYSADPLRVCGGPVAAWFLHDRDDDAVPVMAGHIARDLVLSRNGCSSSSLPLSSECVSYSGCRYGYPVIWCETHGKGHNIAGESAPAQVWRFFSSLP
jgi:poly(3-hydroxybutyrate) depolymerase